MSFGDLALFFLLDILNNKTEMEAFKLDFAAIQKIVDSAPLIKASYEAIGANAGLAKYIKERRSAAYKV